MSKKEVTVPKDKLEIYDKLVAANPNFERKGKTMPYTSVNGHMFSFIDKEGKIAFRLSKEDKKEFNEKYNEKPVIQYGSVMNGYVEIPEDKLSDTTFLSDYLQKSYDYVSSLKPKPTKKS